jgi:hypothetical protein
VASHAATQLLQLRPTSFSAAPASLAAASAFCCAPACSTSFLKAASARPCTGSTCKGEEGGG